MIWFSSDWHYWHKNITYGESVWPDKETKTRRFDTTREMSQKLVDSINKCVKEDDTIYFLGDFSFSGITNIYNFRKQINCKNIFFILGNHDETIRRNKELPNCYYTKHDVGLIVDGANPNTYGDSRDSLFDVYAQDLFTMLPDLISIVHDKQLIVLCHYPIDEWEDMGRGAIMLHGHCHHNIDDCEINTKYKRFDCGWKYKIYSFDEIKLIMDLRLNKLK